MANVKTTEDVTIYRPGGALRFVLSAAFFFVLLFLVNALAGSIWLALHNLPVDALIFFVMALAGTGLLLYATIYLFAASHMEVRLGPATATFVIPDWRGPTPLFPYTECEIPYADIASVETRGEVYRYFVLPVIVESCCLVRKDGKRITLGYVHENAEDPSMPFPAIAARMAERAGVPLVRRGAVEGNRGLRALVQEEPDWDAPELSAERLEALRRSERSRWKYVAIVLAAALATAGAFQLYRLYG
jgi:hypothetical protein